MESNVIIGICVLFFTFSLFSWALGRYINKKKDPKPNEFQNFLAGSWILGLVIVFLTAVLYFG